MNSIRRRTPWAKGRSEVRGLGHQHMKGRGPNGTEFAVTSHGLQIYLFLDGFSESSECPFSFVSPPLWDS